VQEGAIQSCTFRAAKPRSTAHSRFCSGISRLLGIFLWPPKALCKPWITTQPCKTQSHHIRINPAPNPTFHPKHPKIHIPFPLHCGNRASPGTQLTPSNPSFHLPSIPQPGFLKPTPSPTPRQSQFPIKFPLFQPQRVLRRALITLSYFLIHTPQSLPQLCRDLRRSYCHPERAQRVEGPASVFARFTTNWGALSFAQFWGASPCQV
jgi:hypothetical protein